MHALQEVWIRPRKVFRELAVRPVGAVDYVLSAGQGVALALLFSRTKDMGQTEELGQILLQALAQGTISGIAWIWIQAWIYTWLGRQAGGVAKRAQVMHVLSYGSVPLMATLAVWCLAALVMGRQAFMEHPTGETDLFVVLLMGVQTLAYVVPALWSVVLQIMGLSEVHQVRFRGALGTWLLGQAVLTLLALVFLLAVGMPLQPA